MKDYLDLVAQFQKATDQPILESPEENETLFDIEPNIHFLRSRLMAEENEEYLESCQELNKVEMLDACVDMAYILFGTINTHGFQNVFDEAFKRVHQNNMTKVGQDGKVLKNSEGKVIKPKGYKTVDLTDLIN